MTKAVHAAPPLARLARPALVALLVVVAGVFHVWSRTRVLAAGYALGELQKEHVTLASEHDRLRIEVETLRSPAMLERVARTRLGMAPPAPGVVSAAGPPLLTDPSVLVTVMPAPKPWASRPPRFSTRSRRVPWGLIRCSTKSEARSWSIRTPTDTSNTSWSRKTVMTELVTASSSRLMPPAVGRKSGGVKVPGTAVCRSIIPMVPVSEPVISKVPWGVVNRSE